MHSTCMDVWYPEGTEHQTYIAEWEYGKNCKKIKLKMFRGAKK